MEANDDFLRALEKFPEDHHFKLGATGVTIKGGRRPESRRKGRERRKSGKTGIDSESVSKLLARASDEVMEKAERQEKEEFGKSVPDNKKRKVNTE